MEAETESVRQILLNTNGFEDRGMVHKERNAGIP